MTKMSSTKSFSKSIVMRTCQIRAARAASTHPQEDEGAEGGRASSVLLLTTTPYQQEDEGAEGGRQVDDAKQTHVEGQHSEGAER